MTRYLTNDGTIVDTQHAKNRWLEKTRFDGRNQVSLITEDQFLHETLFQSKSGRYYVVRWSDWQGSKATCEWIDSGTACRWLLLCGYELPEDLQALESEILD